MKLKIIILSGILVLMGQAAQAEDFILPKSFSMENHALPPIEQTRPRKETKPEIKISSANKQTAHPQMRLRPVITDISLAELVKNFSYNYSKTLRSTMSALAEFNIKPLYYDSSRGQIRAELADGKELFILLLPSQEKLTHVRITPADGRYDISRELVNDIFSNIERNLYSDVN